MASLTRPTTPPVGFSAGSLPRRNPSRRLPSSCEVRLAPENFLVFAGQRRSRFVSHEREIGRCQCQWQTRVRTQCVVAPSDGPAGELSNGDKGALKADSARLRRVGQLAHRYMGGARPPHLADDGAGQRSLPASRRPAQPSYNNRAHFFAGGARVRKFWSIMR